MVVGNVLFEGGHKVIHCPKCGSEMVEDVIEEIDITDTAIYMDANEVYKCEQCGHVEYEDYDSEEERNE